MQREGREENVQRGVPIGFKHDVGIQVVTFEKFQPCHDCWATVAGARELGSRIAKAKKKVLVMGLAAYGFNAPIVIE